MPNCLASSFDASASSIGISAGSISMIVTSEPKRSKIDANSQPMIPPPRTTRRFGTFSWASRPVESTQRSESSPSIGGRIGNDPVATIACLKVTSSPPSTAIVFASLNAAGALHPLDAVRLEQARDPAGHLLDDRRLPLVRARQVELGRADLDPELAKALLGLLQREGGLHPRLRRDAADAQAGAAELGLLLDTDRPSRRAARRGSRPCSRPGRLRGRQRRIPCLDPSERVGRSRRDRPARALAPPRRQAGLRGPPHLRQPAVHRGSGRARRHRRRDRRRADRRPRLRPARDALRAARDPRGELPAGDASRAPASTPCASCARSTSATRR